MLLPYHPGGSVFGPNAMTASTTSVWMTITPPSSSQRFIEQHQVVSSISSVGEAHLSQRVQTDIECIKPKLNKCQMLRCQNIRSDMQPWWWICIWLTLLCIAVIISIKCSRIIRTTFQVFLGQNVEVGTWWILAFDCLPASTALVVGWPWPQMVEDATGGGTVNGVVFRCFGRTCPRHTQEANNNDRFEASLHLNLHFRMLSERRDLQSCVQPMHLPFLQHGRNSVFHIHRVGFFRCLSTVTSGIPHLRSPIPS